MNTLFDRNLLWEEELRRKDGTLQCWISVWNMLRADGSTELVVTFDDCTTKVRPNRHIITDSPVGKVILAGLTALHVEKFDKRPRNLTEWHEWERSMVAEHERLEREAAIPSDSPEVP